jgi:hypothetical protein
VWRKLCAEKSLGTDKQMTKAERRNKKCLVCGKTESEHPGGQFCKLKPNVDEVEPVEICPCCGQEVYK